MAAPTGFPSSFRSAGSSAPGASVAPGARSAVGPRSSGLPGAAAGTDSLSPPLRLPGEHFTAALAFLICGAVGLVVIAPQLAAGAFFVPQVAAVVHLFTLGWIMLSIFGALCQFLPVAVGRPLRWEPLAHVTFWLQTVGTVVFVTALSVSGEHLLHVGATLVATAFVLFAIHLIVTLSGVRERSLSWWALAGASVFLIVTPVYGFVLALNLHSGLLASERFVFLARHVHVAICGVVLLVMVGVAHRLLPMFLLSHGAGEHAGWTAVALLFGGALLLAVPIGGGLAMRVAAVLVSAGVVAFLVQAGAFLRHSKRRRLDPGMRLAAAGLAGVALSLIVAPFALSNGLAHPSLLVTYHLALLGGISLFVAGHYYKIVPFLVWYHRFGPLVGLRTVPKVSELFPERVALIDGGLLVAGWLGLVVGAFSRSIPLTRASAIVFAAGAVIEAIVIGRVARRRPS
jgi:hypothetical protein